MNKKKVTRNVGRSPSASPRAKAADDGEDEPKFQDYPMKNGRRPSPDEILEMTEDERRADLPRQREELFRKIEYYYGGEKIQFIVNGLRRFDRRAVPFKYVAQLLHMLGIEDNYIEPNRVAKCVYFHIYGHPRSEAEEEAWLAKPDEVDRIKTERWYFMGGTFIAGLVVGFLIARGATLGF